MSILGNIRFLDQEYNKSTLNLSAQKMYGKLALLELCGWVEETIDSIVKDAVVPRLAQSYYLNYFNNTIIERTYGFNYKTYLVNKILIPSIGVIGTQAIERALDQNGYLVILETTLSRLHRERNSAAHTSITNQNNYNAPSLYLADLRRLVPIFRFLRMQLRSLT